MGLTSDRTDKCLTVLRADGQQECYLVLSDEELSKGFVRPIRNRYKHLRCGVITTMAQKIAETYAADPDFYGGTYCVGCRTHFDLRIDGVPQFEWEPDGSAVGS
jgi:hypothetical protein